LNTEPDRNLLHSFLKICTAKSFFFAGIKFGLFRVLKMMFFGGTLKYVDSKVYYKSTIYLKLLFSDNLIHGLAYQ